MQALKILHLASDEMFIDHAIKAFEREAPGCNDLLICGKHPLKHVKSKAKVISAFKSLSTNKSILPKYDIAIVHSLNPIWFRLINSIKKETVIIWLGWGYDYYDVIYKKSSDLLLPETQKKWLKNQEKATPPLPKKIKSIIKKIVIPEKNKTINSIDIFCPVLPCEYFYVAETLKNQAFPVQGLWNYGNLEEDMIKGFENQTITGENILVGNSASAENNHIDTFLLLKKINIKDREVISPLSYGNSNYRDLIIREGQANFGSSFKALVDFMPINAYVETLQSCGFVIMNHIRQQAVGNIVIMLYLGAKVFLNKKCPTFSHLKSQGAVIFTTDELQLSPSMINEPLTRNEISRNREALAKTWSKEVSQQRTRELLELAASIKK